MIRIINLDYMTHEEDAKITAAIDLINQALHDQDFATAFFAEKMTETQSFSRAQILQMLGLDADLEIKFYSKWWSKVIGYFSGGDTIWVNLKFFWGFSVAQVASNLLHEFSHYRGFTHNGVWGTSVPYTLNRVFEAWAARKGLGQET